MQRKEFIQKTLVASAILTTAKPFGVFAKIKAIATEKKNVVNSLTILHTNDVHSRLDAFPEDGSKLAGQGGISARKKIIDTVKAQNKHVLLLDAGDIFQGTPYFNLYKGEPEIKAMSFMGYDATTMGNHDFDGGIQNFADQLQHAKFKVVVCNYNFTDTPLENLVKPFTIVRKGNLKIGIIGVGIELKGLVPEALYGATQYLDPVKNANYYAHYLKNTKKCDMVICLSHLGFEYKNAKISDKTFASQTRNIDLILGGHTHTFLDEPFITKNADGKQIVINQVGWAGVRLGCLQFDFFQQNGMQKSRKGHTVFDVK